MTKDYLVVLDACVLVGAALRDTLLRLAETPRLYVPKWSDDILAETERTLQKYFRKTAAQTQHLISELQKTFPEACVYGYKCLINAMTNHEKDRHVLATAVRCSAQTIVTFNVKHFRCDDLRQYDVEALHPDEFLVNQFHLDEAVVTSKFTEQAAAIGRTVEERLRAFHQTKALPLFTRTLASALSLKID
jgi:predicted nucleic acid-binding protein